MLYKTEIITEVGRRTDGRSIETASRLNRYISKKCAKRGTCCAYLTNHPCSLASTPQTKIKNHTIPFRKFQAFGTLKTAKITKLRNY
mgnify:FL=1